MQVTTDRRIFGPWFNTLAGLLVQRNLAEGFRIEHDCPNYPDKVRRDVSVDEFMYMGHDAGADQNDGITIHFKHRDSRNYLYLMRASATAAWGLVVPENDKCFTKGFFDTFGE